MMSSSDYIDDVPMKFSERSLSLLKNSVAVLHDDDRENENCDHTDLDRFKVDEYKFESELSALEMYELNERRKQREKSRREALEAEMEKTKKRMEEAALQCINQGITQNAMMHHPFVPGEILQPQLLFSKDNNVSSAPAMVSPDQNGKLPPPSCDNPGSSEDIKLITNATTTKVNPKEFENNLDSSPFDNVELQTIDDISELNKVFQGLSATAAAATSTSTAKTSGGIEVPHNSPVTINAVDDPLFAPYLQKYPGTAFNSVYPSTTYDHHHHQNAYHSGGIGYKFSYQNQNFLPTQPLTVSPFPEGIVPNNHNLFYGMKVNPTMYHHYNHQPPAPPYSSLTMSSVANMFGGVMAAATPLASSAPVMPLPPPSRSKSVSDLSCDPQQGQSATDHTRYERSRTPPHGTGGNPNGMLPSNTIINHDQPPKISNRNIDNSRGKTLARFDPYETLNERQKEFVDRLCQMGYQRDRISRAVKHMDIDDDKKIYEFLLDSQKLEDQGYDCYDVEIALHFNNYVRTKAEQFLNILKQLCDFGFNKDMAIKALLKSNNNRDKAIELLRKECSPKTSR